MGVCKCKCVHAHLLISCARVAGRSVHERRVYGNVYDNCTYTEIVRAPPTFLELNYGKAILEAEGRRTGGAEANHTL